MAISLEVFQWVFGFELVIVDQSGKVLMFTNIGLRLLYGNLRNIIDHFRQDDDSLKLMSRIPMPQIFLPNTLDRRPMGENVPASMIVGSSADYLAYMS